MDCEDCKRVANDLGHKTPVGWLPFAEGEGGHFYVFPETQKDRGSDGAEQVDAVPLCEVRKPERRG